MEDPTKLPVCQFFLPPPPVWFYQALPVRKGRSCCCFSCCRVWVCVSPGLDPARLLCPWGFSRQEHWSGLPAPSPGDLLDPGVKPTFPALAGGFFTTDPPGKPKGRRTRRITWRSRKKKRNRGGENRTELEPLSSVWPKVICSRESSCVCRTPGFPTRKSSSRLPSSQILNLEFTDSSRQT